MQAGGPRPGGPTTRRPGAKPLKLEETGSEASPADSSPERDETGHRRARSPRGNPHETEELHRLLVASVRDYAIFALDPTGHILSWNVGAERLKGYKPREIIGRHFSIFYPPADIKAGKPGWLLMVAESEGRVEDEGWRVRKDGSRMWANVVITALRDASGELVGFGKVTRDLTDRRRAEEALRESEERFRLIVQSVQDYGIFMLDPRGRIASWNEGAERINGYTREEILGRHFSIFYPAEDQWKPEAELRIATQAGRFEEEGWRVRKDGRVFWANIVITALHGEQGELVGFAKVTRDLTERRAAQERAIADARRIAEAEAANRAKAEFLAAMSHELRTPLNAIGGYVDLLSFGVRGPVTEQQIEDLDRIRRAQQHLLGIINDLLNFSRIEAGRLSYDIGPVPLLEVTDAVRPMVEQQAAAKRIELEWPTRRIRAVAVADQAKLEQILLNLLTNAVKFTPDGGRIVVSASSQRDHICLSVADNGVGIPAEKLETIFEPFVQVGRTLSSTHEGTGLGLAISRDLARAMGGDITVSSKLGSGSTFTVRLPREPGSTEG